jgi:hypothetical protein
MDDFRRWVTPGRGNIYELCYAQNGSDSNDGMGGSGTCLAHVQTAVNLIGTQWDGGGYNSCAIGLYGGGTNTINESVSQTGASVGCYLTVNVRGAVTWSNSGSCWNLGDGSILVWNGNLGSTTTFACNTSNTALTGQFYGHQIYTLDFNGPFQWNPGGLLDTFHVADAQGRATFDNSTKVVGNGTAVSANSLVNCSNGCSGITVSGTWAFSANVTLGVAYVIRNGGYVIANATYSGGLANTPNPTTPTGGARLLANGTQASIPGGTSPSPSGSAVLQNTSFGTVCGGPC